MIMRISLIFLLFSFLGCQSNSNQSKNSQNLNDGNIFFSEITASAGLNTEPSWKYGGPSIADINSDGRYDFLLGNHDRHNAHLFWGQQNNILRPHDSAIAAGDLHGLAPGDFDLDGDLDIIYLIGGGNGLKPQPPILLRNDNGQFVDITESSGLSKQGARGRSPRWIDMNTDGYLDLLLINAAQLKTETGPRNLVYKNNGDGTFTYQPNTGVEQIEAEKVLVTDFNGDHISDMVTFTPLAFFQGNNDFTFENVTEKLLPNKLHDIQFVNAVANVDIDNDGDLDFYLARGKTHYQTANNALSFDKSTGRLDLRDEGNKGRDGITLIAGDHLQLSEFWHWPRGIKIELPVYLGKDQTRIDTPKNNQVIDSQMAAGFPEEINKNGWFLGYLGNNEWRLEWNLNANLAWGIRASIGSVKDIKPDWEPQDLGVDDILLRNDGKLFTDVSHKLPSESSDNNWGVTHGDFDNNGFTDFFVYRFGELVWRQSDVLMLNQRGSTFKSQLKHSANYLPEKSHGDMGSAFDYDLDGQVDLLSGDDDYGKWRLYKNTNKNSNRWVLVDVGYSDQGIDAHGAEIRVETENGQHFRRVGSAGVTHSQSLLNIAHFGLSNSENIKRIHVRWRDGSEQSFENIISNQYVIFGKNTIDNNKRPSVVIHDAEALNIIDPNAELELLADGFRWTEGPLWVEDGQYLLFSDIPNNNIHKYQPNHGTKLWLENSGATGIKQGDYSGGSNGLLLDAEGNLVLFQQGDRRVASMTSSLIQPQAKFKTLAGFYNQQRLNSPNDGVFHSNGALYFTDPPYGLDNRMDDDRKELDFQGVYRLSSSGELKLLDQHVNFPNGIALINQEKTLIVAVSDHDHPRWLAYDLDENGDVSNKRIFHDASDLLGQGGFQGVPDGMAVSRSGYLYATGPGGVWIFSPDGRVLAKILTGRLTANCTLSGDEKELYITAHDTLMRIPLK